MRPDLESGDENPYEFIFSQDKQNTGQNGKQPVRNPFTKQYAIFGVFAAGVLIVAGILAVLIFAEDPPTAPELVRVRAYQNEIARVSEVGNNNLGNFDLRKDVYSLNLVIKTDRARVAQLISNRMVATTAAELRQARNTSRDKRLSESLEVDRHDTVYREIMDELVAGYYNAVRSAETVALTENERVQLGVVKKNIEIIYLDDDEIEPTETPQEPEATPEEEPTPTLTN